MKQEVEKAGWVGVMLEKSKCYEHGLKVFEIGIIECFSGRRDKRKYGFAGTLKCLI